MRLNKPYFFEIFVPLFIFCELYPCANGKKSANKFPHHSITCGIFIPKDYKSNKNSKPKIWDDVIEPIINV